MTIKKIFLLLILILSISTINAFGVSIGETQSSSNDGIGVSIFPKPVIPLTNASQIDHNALNQIQGGGNDEKYHINLSEYTELQTNIFNWITKSSVNNTYLRLDASNDPITGNLDINANLDVSNNFSVDTSTLFVNSNTNNVGIGTNNPDSLLHINGSGTALNITNSTGEGIFYVNTTSGGVRVGGTTNIYGELDVTVDGGNSQLFVVSYGGSSSIIGYSPRGIFGSATANQEDDVLFQMVGQGYDTSKSTGGAIKFEADAEWGTSGDPSDAPTRITFHTVPDGSGSLNERMIITNKGDVGIGTSSPSTNLEVSDTRETRIRIKSTRDSSWSAGDEFGALEFYSDDSSGAGAGVRSSIRVLTPTTSGGGSAMTFSTTDGTTNDIERMRINLAGNIGVGTTSPSTELEINGTLTTDNLVVNELTTFSDNVTINGNLSVLEKLCVNCTDVYGNNVAQFLGRVNVTDLMTVKSINVTSGESIAFLLDNNETVIISATTFTSFDNKSRSSLFVSGDLGMFKSSNQTTGLGVINFDNSNLAGATMGLTVDNQDSFRILKHSGGFIKPKETIFLNEKGNMQLLNLNSTGIIGFGYMDNIEVYSDISIGDTIGEYHLMEISPTNITFNGTIYSNNNIETDENITASYGFFDYLGSLTNRIKGLFVEEINFNGTISGDNITIWSDGGNVTTDWNMSAEYYCFNDDNSCITVKNRVKAIKNGNQSILNAGTWNNITFGNESFDYGDMHNTSINNKTIVIQKTGMYSIGYHLKISSADKTSYDSRILLNGEELHTACDTNVGSKESSYITLGTYDNSFELNEGDELILQVRHDGGGTETLIGIQAYFQVKEEW